jgi:protein TonB
MNANRDLVWGIVLSLLVHGAFLGFPLSPGGRRFVHPHQPSSLEVSLVPAKDHEDGQSKKMIISPTPPEGVGQNATVREKPTAEKTPSLTHITRPKQNIRVRRGKTEKRAEKPVSAPREKPPPSSEEEKDHPLLPKPLDSTLPVEAASTAPQQQGGEGKHHLPSPSPPGGKPVEGEGLAASLIREGGEQPLEIRPIPVVRPRYDRNPKPPYPRIARRKGYEGVVVLKVEILPDGRVGEILVKKSSGYPVLDQSALKTVRQWRFVPAERGGNRIRMWAEIPIRFELE